MINKILSVLSIVLMAGLLSASILTPNIEKTIQSAKDDTEALKIIHDYISQTDDLEDLRIIQNYWLRLDKSECILFFSTLKDRHPKDIRYLYLWARSTEDDKTQINTGRKLISRNPDFEYGYRLLLSVYQKQLFITPDASHPSAQVLMKDFKKDKKYFEQYLQKFPNNENAIYLTLNLLVWEKKVSAANRLLAKALDSKASWLNWQFYTDYYLKTNQLLMLQTYIRRMVDTSSATKKLSQDEKESQVELTYLNTLLIGEAYQAFLDYLHEHPEAKNRQEIQKMLLLVYIYQGDFDKAFFELDIMLTKPNDYYGWLVSDKDFTQLRNDPRWLPRMAEFKRYWDLGSNKRKAAVLAGKFSKPAPQWELKDIEGNLIKLSDYKGYIVILDFWATWCSPCKDAMPFLNNWMISQMPDSVKVFSINIWERDSSVAAPFMIDNQYRMTMLYGYNDLSKEYGFSGIPYICVIDKEGLIRFEAKGYSPELAENLTVWVEDLK